MAIAEPISPPKPRPLPPPNHRWSGYLHLLAARMKELRREPEVIFWVFGFPLLLALGLGIAFRNKPADIDLDRYRQRPRRRLHHVAHSALAAAHFHPRHAAR